MHKAYKFIHTHYLITNSNYWIIDISFSKSWKIKEETRKDIPGYKRNFIDSHEFSRLFLINLAFFGIFWQVFLVISCSTRLRCSFFAWLGLVVVWLGRIRSKKVRAKLGYFRSTSCQIHFGQIQSAWTGLTVVLESLSGRAWVGLLNSQWFGSEGFALTLFDRTNQFQILVIKFDVNDLG